MCDQIRSFLRIWWHLLKKSLTENFIFLYRDIKELYPIKYFGVYFETLINTTKILKSINIVIFNQWIAGKQLFQITVVCDHGHRFIGQLDSQRSIPDLFKSIWIYLDPFLLKSIWNIYFDSKANIQHFFLKDDNKSNNSNSTPLTLVRYPRHPR